MGAGWLPADPGLKATYSSSLVPRYSYGKNTAVRMSVLRAAHQFKMFGQFFFSKGSQQTTPLRWPTMHARPRPQTLLATGSRKLKDELNRTHLFPAAATSNVRILLKILIQFYFFLSI